MERNRERREPLLLEVDGCFSPEEAEGVIKF
jgi:hypothetical protein